MQPDERAVAEANELYWDSDTPIAEIAERLDLSRRALYDAVQPLSAGERCGRCGGDLLFANRSSRKSGFATCAECGAEDLVEDTVTGDPKTPHLSVIKADAAASVREDARAQDLRHRAVVLGGAAIAGVAIGSVAAWLATRRE